MQRFVPERCFDGEITLIWKKFSDSKIVVSSLSRWDAQSSSLLPEKVYLKRFQSKFTCFMLNGGEPGCTIFLSLAQNAGDGLGVL